MKLLLSTPLALSLTTTTFLLLLISPSLRDASAVVAVDAVDAAPPIKVEGDSVSPTLRRPSVAATLTLPDASRGTRRSKRASAQNPPDYSAFAMTTKDQNQLSRQRVKERAKKRQQDRRRHARLSSKSASTPSTAPSEMTTTTSSTDTAPVTAPAVLHEEPTVPLKKEDGLSSAPIDAEALFVRGELPGALMPKNILPPALRLQEIHQAAQERRLRELYGREQHFREERQKQRLREYQERYQQQFLERRYPTAQQQMMNAAVPVAVPSYQIPSQPQSQPQQQPQQQQQPIVQALPPLPPFTWPDVGYSLQPAQFPAPLQQVTDPELVHMFQDLSWLDAYSAAPAQPLSEVDFDVPAMAAASTVFAPTAFTSTVFAPTAFAPTAFTSNVPDIVSQPAIKKEPSSASPIEETKLNDVAMADSYEDGGGYGADASQVQGAQGPIFPDVESWWTEPTFFDTQNPFTDFAGMY